jgi:hypothetical protein
MIFPFDTPCYRYCHSNGQVLDYYYTSGSPNPKQTWPEIFNRYTSIFANRATEPITDEL